MIFYSKTAHINIFGEVKILAIDNDLASFIRKNQDKIFIMVKPYRIRHNSIISDQLVDCQLDKDLNKPFVYCIHEMHSFHYLLRLDIQCSKLATYYKLAFYDNSSINFSQ